MADWRDEDVAAFVEQARGELVDPLPVLQLQKLLV